MTFLTATSLPAGAVLIWAVYSGFGVMAWLLVYYSLPETKGRSLETILQLFQSVQLPETEQ